MGNPFRSLKVFKIFINFTGSAVQSSEVIDENEIALLVWVEGDNRSRHFELFTPVSENTVMLNPEFQQPHAKK